LSATSPVVGGVDNFLLPFTIAPFVGGVDGLNSSTYLRMFLTDYLLTYYNLVVFCLLLPLLWEV